MENGVDEMLMTKRSWQMQLDPSMMAVLNVNPLNHQRFMASCESIWVQIEDGMHVGYRKETLWGSISSKEGNHDHGHRFVHWRKMKSCKSRCRRWWSPGQVERRCQLRIHSC